jgi:hypothetical protein
VGGNSAAGPAESWVVGGLIVDLLSPSLTCRSTTGHADENVFFK